MGLDMPDDTLPLQQEQAIPVPGIWPSDRHEQYLCYYRSQSCVECVTYSQGAMP